jgi:hypothetical protein
MSIMDRVLTRLYSTLACATVVLAGIFAHLVMGKDRMVRRLCVAFLALFAETASAQDAMGTQVPTTNF